MNDDLALLTVPQVASLFSVRSATIRRWCAQGRLPVVHVGAAVRFSRQHLRALISQSETPATRPLARRGASLHIAKTFPDERQHWQDMAGYCYPAGKKWGDATVADAE